MTIFEYLKMSYLRPNPFVLKSLGASNDLIMYLRKTPENTNMNIVKSMIENSNDEGLVIINGIPDSIYSSGNNCTSIGFLFESEPTTLGNIKVGTTFTVEINDETYNFTIATISTEVGNRVYASSETLKANSFKLADTIEGFACEMLIEGDVRPITHFKVIQTSDYEDGQESNLPK